MEESKSIADQKINKLKLKNADKKKIDRWMNESKAMSMKMSDINKRYSKNREDINKLFNEIVNDKDVVYTRSKLGSTGSSLKDEINLNKELSKKYGKTTYLSKDGAVKSVTNDKVIVKAATNRNKNKKKFTDPNRKKLYGPTYTKTTYYVY